MQNRCGGAVAPLFCASIPLYTGACSKGMLKGRGRSWERPRPLRPLVCLLGWRLRFLCGFGAVAFAEYHLHSVVQCFAHHGDGGVGGGLSAYSGKDFAGGLAGELYDA